MSDAYQVAGIEDESGTSRANFLKGSALAVAGLAFGSACGTHAAPAGTELSAFLNLSRVVSGVDDLPVPLAKAYYSALETDGVLKLKPSQFAKLAGFTARGGPATVAELERSSAYGAAGAHECLQTVAAAWWGGVVPTVGGGTRIMTFTNALVWREVHEPATCQGVTGSWAKPGRAVE